jgi:2-amino-4-hydroxy-6-hydroxymethyldihydropteridine diphosphokinase
VRSSLARLDAVVGLGSNLGERAEHLRDAVRQIAAVFDVVARSAIYETAPVGPAQPDYLNAAVRLRSSETIEQLLAVLLGIEHRSGRVRSEATRWGPRTIDLDVLWADGVVVSTPTLTVPHPRLAERAFALRPLHDVAPDALDPRTGVRFPDSVDDPDVRRTSLVL